MRYFRLIFDDWLTRAAGIVLLLTIIVVAFNTWSGLPDKHPVLGVLSYAFVPALFIFGGIIFVLAILSLRE